LSTELLRQRNPCSDQRSQICVEKNSIDTPI
jgi:hypothetical protein